jgi:hypothetical protein
MLKQVKRENIDLLFTDTDSLCYHVRNHDIFKIMKDNKDEFDLSDYPKDHELYDPKNKKVIGKMKNDKYEGRCIFVGKNAETIADNIYVDGKKNGPGYQFEISNKKLFKGNWKDGNWVSATESSYTTFLTDSRFYSEKTDNQIIMGNLDSKKGSTLFPVGSLFLLKKYEPRGAVQNYFGNR